MAFPSTSPDFTTHMSSRIAYVVNQYPKISHTFIRREILALERQGFVILRISIRGWDSELTDEEDQLERSHTRYILQNGTFTMLWDVLRTFLTRPVRFMLALKLAIRMSKGADRSLPYHLVYFAEACRIFPWIKSFGATHVHAHFSTNSTEVAMLTNALGGPPYSFTVHGLVELQFGGLLEKIRRAAFIVVISSFGRSQLYHRIEHALWHKVKVVHCGLETAFHAIDTTPASVEPHLVCVGRLSKEKGQLLLIEVARNLAEKGINFKLVLAGDGEMRTELERLIAQYKLSRHIRITGWLSSNQVRDEILAARSLVLPSFSEGLPVVIMEAMALRRPVLATYVGGIPELVVPQENGWLFPAGSIDDMAAAIENCLLQSPDKLKKMGDAAYHRVMERHMIDIEAAKLAEYFHSAHI